MPVTLLRSRRGPALLAAALACAGVLPCARAQAADPTKDQCIDANETAQALRKNEKLHDAEQRYMICVSTSCPGPVREDCAQRLTELRSLIPTIVFSVKDDADQDLSDVHVTMDDQPLTDKVDGTAIAIDPGPHHFVFEAAGRQKEERSIVVREGEKDRHEKVVLVVESVAPVVAAPAAGSAPPAAAEAPPKDGKAQRIAGLVVGSIGAAGLIVGGVFGIVSKSTYDTATRECTRVPEPCSPVGVSDGKTAHSQATVSTVAFIAGGALLVAGGVLVFTAPRGVTVSPTVGMRSAGVGVNGSF
jgi:hypothetical protein